MEKSRRILGGLLVLVLALVAGAAPAAAQNGAPARTTPEGTAPDGRVARLALGVGPGSLGSGVHGPALRAGFTFSTRPGQIVTVRASSVQEVAIFTSPAESAWDVGILYGVAQRDHRTSFSASAGVALVGGMRRGGKLPSRVRCPPGSALVWCGLASMFEGERYEEDPFETVGIPLDVEMGWTPLDGLGLSFGLFFTVTRDGSHGGLTLAVLLGDVR